MLPRAVKQILRPSKIALKKKSLRRRKIKKRLPAVRKRSAQGPGERTGVPHSRETLLGTALSRRSKLLGLLPKSKKANTHTKTPTE